jgi:nicotinamidase-related amidase
MNRALIVVDVQESFRVRPSWRAVSDPGIASKVGRLVDAARADGDFMAWILHTEPGTGSTFDPSSGHVRLLEELEPRDGEPVLTKTSHNAFTTTNLQQQLTARGIRGLTVCGIRTEQCCETTTRIASDLGYDVTFAVDATATHPIPHRDLPAGSSLDEILADPRTLGTGDVIARTEYALSGRFATIATVAELTGAAVSPGEATLTGS